MKKHALGLTIATLLLTACGGSDSNDNPAVDPGKPNNGGNNPPTAPGKNDNTPSAPNDSGKNNDGSSQLIPPPVNQGGQQNKDKAVGQFQGKAFVVPLGKQPNGLADAQSVGSDKLNVLNINGKQLPLEIANIRAGNMLRMQNSTVDGKSYKLFVVSGTIYQNQKFGYINDGNEDYIFSQGAPTANMPTAGVAKYSGAAAVGRAAVADTALANFSANFGEKTLTATASAPRATPPSAVPAASTATTPANSAVSSRTARKHSPAALAQCAPAPAATKSCVCHTKGRLATLFS